MTKIWDSTGQIFDLPKPLKGLSKEGQGTMAPEGATEIVSKDIVTTVAIATKEDQVQETTLEVILETVKVDIATVMLQCMDLVGPEGDKIFTTVIGWLIGK